VAIVGYTKQPELKPLEEYSLTRHLNILESELWRKASLEGDTENATLADKRQKFTRELQRDAEKKIGYH
jgi:hypothetical protein